MPKKTTGRKQGNQGHFHGEPLALLESFAQAYVDAGTNKTVFWKDFWTAWYKEYPPLETSTSSNDPSSNDPSSNNPSESNDSSSKDPSSNDSPSKDPSDSTSATNGAVDEVEDPDVKNARAASHQKIKSWFSNRATKFKNREKNPFLHYLRHLDKKLVPPRLVPIHKYFMQIPQYAEEVEALYRRKFVNKGGSGKAVDANEDEEEEEVDQLDEDQEPGSGNAPVQQEGEKDGENDEGDLENGESDAGDEEGRQSSEDLERKALALSRRVSIASLLFASKPKEVKEEVVL
ncbi:hypothetical protein EV360DRAFT_89451 [Lentinula raphanica]|nr:hypothetical protein EV360DRAFT_89451 [Lentinula raphanica]